MGILKKYKTAIAVFVSVFVLLGILVVVCMIYGNQNGPVRDIIGKVYSIFDMDDTGDNKSNYQKMVDLLFKENDTIVYLYGDDLKFEETHYDNKDYSNEVNLKKISKITKEVIRPNDEFNILIFNNLSGENDISEEELNIISEATKNSNFSFYYVGNRMLDEFVKYDIFGESTFQPGDICIANIYEDGDRTHMSGIYTETDDSIVNGGVKYSGLDDYILMELELRYRSEN